jgi:hypothetical protein
MSIEFTVEGKVIGQKRPLFTDWHIKLLPIDDSQGDHLKLRDLIRSIVANEVDAFQTRQEQRKLAQVMSKQKIEQGAQKGKIDPGEKEFQQSVDVEDAVAVALQALEDGLYYVFVDEVQQMHLDGEVFLKNNSRVVFLRLTALVGG